MNKRKHILSTFVIFTLWYLFSLLLNKNLLPNPINVLQHLFKIFGNRMAIHVVYSLMRIFSGILLGVLIGWPLGIFLGYFKKADTYLSPLIYQLYPIPKVALLPIFMLLFGLGEMTKITLIFIIILFQIIVNIRDHIKTIDESTYYPLKALGSSNLQIIRHIMIPATMPKLFSSIRISLGTAISLLFFSETFGTTYGIGYFIMDSMLRINYVEMYSGIVVLSIMGLTLFSLIDFIGNRFVKWK